MIKRLLINIILAFSIVPILSLIRDYVKIGIMKDNTVFSGTFEKYVQINAHITFLVAPLLFLILILLPYNAIQIFLHKRKTLIIWQKLILFFSILIIVTVFVGAFITNVWSPGWKVYLNYFLLYAILTLLFVIPLHYWVDKDGKAPVAA